eukprot:13108614-Ditylum_brightwellii.AAC.2
MQTDNNSRNGQELCCLGGKVYQGTQTDENSGIGLELLVAALKAKSIKILYGMCDIKDFDDT